jgi:hypothetical protein
MDRRRRRVRLIAIAYGKNGPHDGTHPDGFWARFIPGELVDGSPRTPPGGGEARLLVVEPISIDAAPSHLAVVYLSYPYPNDDELSERATAILDAWRAIYRGG